MAWISHKWRLNGAQERGYHIFQMLIVLLKLIIGPPGSSVHGISQARIREWAAISLSGDLPDLGMDPHLLHWQADSLPLSH